MMLMLVNGGGRGGALSVTKTIMYLMHVYARATHGGVQSSLCKTAAVARAGW